jgi:hypothetical protein
MATAWRRGDALFARTEKTCRRSVFDLFSALDNSVVYPSTETRHC